jgi:hypothetical protein
VSDDAHEMAVNVGLNVTLTTFDFLPASKPRRPSLSVIFTDRLSITLAIGLASRPSFSQAFITSVWLMLSDRPSSRHAAVRSRPGGSPSATLATGSRSSRPKEERSGRREDPPREVDRLASVPAPAMPAQATRHALDRLLNEDARAHNEHG